MKRTKYGKNPQKTIYVPPQGKYNELWKQVIDYADKTGEGVGIILLKAWEKQK